MEVYHQMPTAITPTRVRENKHKSNSNSNNKGSSKNQNEQVVTGGPAVHLISKAGCRGDCFYGLNCSGTDDFNPSQVNVDAFAYGYSALDTSKNLAGEIDVVRETSAVAAASFPSLEVVVNSDSKKSMQYQQYHHQHHQHHHQQHPQRQRAASADIPKPRDIGDIDLGMSKSNQNPSKNADCPKDATLCTSRKVILASPSARNLMRQVSGLGMEDPVFGTREEGPSHPSQFYDDMSVGDLPEDMRDLISIASDPTATQESGLDAKALRSCLALPPVKIVKDIYVTCCAESVNNASISSSTAPMSSSTTFFSRSPTRQKNFLGSNKSQQSNSNTNSNGCVAPKYSTINAQAVLEPNSPLDIICEDSKHTSQTSASPIEREIILPSMCHPPSIRREITFSPDPLPPLREIPTPTVREIPLSPSIRPPIHLGDSSLPILCLDDDDARRTLPEIDSIFPQETPTALKAAKDKQPTGMLRSILIGRRRPGTMSKHAGGKNH